MRSPAIDAGHRAAIIGDDGSTAQMIEQSTSYLADHLDANLDAINRNVNSVGSIASMAGLGIAVLLGFKIWKGLSR
jgi:hypothetical protein